MSDLESIWTAEVTKIQQLEEENERVREENARLRTLITAYENRGRMNVDCNERDALRRALEYTEENIGCIQDGSSTQKWLRIVRAALEGKP